MCRRDRENIDIARGFDGPARLGQHVEAHEAVHSGNPDGGKQRRNGRRDQRDEQGREQCDRDLSLIHI